jgi:enamine deaminase RidA (YjgF/YER057c/UK114 family)
MTHGPYTRLQSLGIILPPAIGPVGTFAPATITGPLMFLSGHIARREGLPWVGRLGETLTQEEGCRAARAVAIDLLATMQAAVQDLACVRRILKMTVFVNSAPTFTDQPLIANGASDLFREVFGDSGVHARSAVGVAQLPFGSCVEIELVAEVARACNPGS